MVELSLFEVVLLFGSLSLVGAALCGLSYRFGRRSGVIETWQAAHADNQRLRVLSRQANYQCMKREIEKVGLHHD